MEPLKRHPALKSISRKHHEVLLLAQILRNDVPTYDGMPKTAEEKRRHYQKEYSQLLEPLLAQDQALIAHMPENPSIKSLLNGLQDFDMLIIKASQQWKEAERGADFIDSLAQSLIGYVRFKERQLFEAMQSYLTPEKLEELVGYLEKG